MLTAANISYSESADLTVFDQIRQFAQMDRSKLREISKQHSNTNLVSSIFSDDQKKRASNLFDQIYELLLQNTEPKISRTALSAIKSTVLVSPHQESSQFTPEEGILISLPYHFEGTYLYFLILIHELVHAGQAELLDFKRLASGNFELPSQIGVFNSNISAIKIRSALEAGAIRWEWAYLHSMTKNERSALIAATKSLRESDATHYARMISNSAREWPEYLALEWQAGRYGPKATHSKFWWEKFKKYSFYSGCSAVAGFTLLKIFF